MFIRKTGWTGSSSTGALVAAGSLQPSMTKSQQASNRRRKTLYIRIRDGNPSIKSTRQKRTQVDKTQRKNKSKQSTPKKKRKKKGKNNATLSYIYFLYPWEFHQRLFNVLWWMKEVVVTQSLSFCLKFLYFDSIIKVKLHLDRQIRRSEEILFKLTPKAWKHVNPKGKPWCSGVPTYTSAHIHCNMCKYASLGSSTRLITRQFKKISHVYRHLPRQMWPRASFLSPIPFEKCAKFRMSTITWVFTIQFKFWS